MPAETSDRAARIAELERLIDEVHASLDLLNVRVEAALQQSGPKPPQRERMADAA
jgi:hypothetical protein